MSKEIDNFNFSFENEILDIAFILKEPCCSVSRSGKEKYYTLSIAAIAYKNITANEIIENENILIQKKVKETISYFQILKSNSIVRLKVRKKKNPYNFHIVFLLEDIIDTDYKDDDLNIILNEYSETIYYKDETLGNFKLNKFINNFEKDISWIDDKTIVLSFDNADNEYNKNCINIIKKIIKNKEYIDKKVKKYAAENILKDAYICKDNKPHINKYIKLLSIKFINIYDACIEFYLDDGGVFGWHIIIVNSRIDFNFTDVYIAG